MTEQQPEKQTADKKKSSLIGVLAAAALALVIVAVLMFFLPNGGGDGIGGDGGGDPGAATQLQANLTKLRSALVATENLDTVSAQPDWDSLLELMPDDASLARNRALNRVLRIDQLAETINSPNSSTDEKKAARIEASSSISVARDAITDFKRVSKNEVMSLWLSSRIDLHEASLLPRSMTDSMQLAVFNRVSERFLADLGDDPESIILGAPLIQVLDTLGDRLPASAEAKTTELLSALSDKHPENLLLAVRAAQNNFFDENKQTPKYIDRVARLSKPINPLLDDKFRSLKKTTTELVEAIENDIEAGDWDKASTNFSFWLNVLNPSEIVRADRRRVDPHPLDRLSFETLRRMNTTDIESQPLGKGDSAIGFKASPIDAADNTIAFTPLDFDLDLVDDLATLSKAGLIRLWRNDDLDWVAAGEINVAGEPNGLLVADLFMVDSSHPQRIKSDVKRQEIRHDTYPSLVVYGDSGIDLVALDSRTKTAQSSRLKIVDKTKAGFGDVSGAVQVIAGDFEGDGDLDLAVATKSDGLRLFVNRGNRTFFEITDHDGGFDKSDPIGKMAIVDIDRDLDLDIITVHPGSGRIGVLENLLHLQFRGRMIENVPTIKDASNLAIADVDGNISWDVIYGGPTETAVVFSQTADAGVWTVERAEKKDTASGSMALADLDNDSWNEMLVDGGVVRIGPWGIGDLKPIDSMPTITGLHLTDFDADGLLDYVAMVDNKLTVGINQTETNHQHLMVRFKGINDNAENSGRVNHFGIGSVLEARFGPHYRSQIVTSPATHFGIAGFDTASSVRVIMPNGLTQTIREPKVDTIVEEKQSLKGSCPYLYAWDGEKYVFVTDCLWAAPLGLQVADGVVAKDRPWEYLKVDGTDIQPRDGKYSFRITEELWEVAYFDKLALTVVDHPADIDVWTNEKVGPGNIAKQTIFAFAPEDVHDLTNAVDTKGRDVTESLGRIDRDFVQGFDRRLRQGLCEPHWIDMDFGDVEIADDDHVYMVLTGWILPTDTSLNIQIDQNPALPAIEFPSVWVPDPDTEAQWRKVIPFMGFPGGKTKTIVVDVTNSISKDDPRLRVRTSAQIYWDCAQLAIQSDVPKIVTQETSLLSAEVSHRGFSKSIKESSKHPETYDYQSVSTAPKWPPLRGELSRFGHCKTLLGTWDDLMVVIGAGDEIAVEFSVPEKPIPEGWKRDFILHCVGWDKDADLNTLSGQTIGPIPFRDMSSYPPSVDDRKKSQSVKEKNRDHLRRHQSFRAFWNRPES